MWTLDFFVYFQEFLLVGFGLIGMYLFKNTKPDFRHVRSDYLSLKRVITKLLRKGRNENGNVFLAIFAAVALVGLLSASVMTFMKGPLSTSIRLTKMNTAENQMSIGAQVAVMATASQTNNGDCELIDPDGAGPLPAVGDGYVEPIPFRTPTTEPVPVGGGLVPQTLGISKKDPWGTEYGYCVWNHGPSTAANGCDANMLAGTNSMAYPVVAIISAGPDKAFTTTCRSFADADVTGDGDLLDATDLPMVQKAAETDDDIITSFTYNEATGASGGLWSLKSGEPGTAVIGKNIETTGTASLKGGLLLPDKSFVACDATTAGVMAMNGSAIEICNGTTWDAITGGGAVGGGLVLTPNVSTGMDVDGTCGTSTCYSSNVTFTVTNNLSPAATSAALVTTLSNTTNFEFVSNNCSGQTLAPAATCQMVVRAKTTGNVSYAGTLQITGHNSPFAMLDGVGSSFPGCNVGGAASGGYYIGCAVNGYNLIATPSGCSAGTTNPICGGGGDSVIKTFGSTGSYRYEATDGAQATVDYMGYSGGSVSFPAAAYCSALVYQGFDDWYLPSMNEFMNYIHTNAALLNINKAAFVFYWTSTETWGNSANARRYYGYYNNTEDSDRAGTLLVRCLRREAYTMPSPTPDSTPAAVSFTTSSTTTAGTALTSNGITVYGVTSPITVSVSGGTGAMFSKNGGGYTNTATTASNGDTITLRATAPTAGTEQIVTLTLGSISSTWRVRTLANTSIRVFTTRDIVGNGNLGGTGGGNGTCTTRANLAGLGGNWVAMLTGPSASLEPLLPWNWVTMKNMNNQLVATSLSDFLDGSVSAPMSYDEYGNPAASSLVWTGIEGIVSGVVQGDVNPSWTCSGFTTNSSGQTGNYGDSSSLSAGNYFRVGGSATAICNVTSMRLLCIETVGTAGLDGDPDAVNVAPAVAYTAGGVATSNTVTVTGIVGSVMVTITPSAGTANIIKNGASVGSNTTNVNNNDTIAFSLTTPTTAGQKNTATLTFGPDSYSWWAGYADNANIGMMFVTSASYQGALGGLAGADTKCQTVASAAGLNGTWTALLSSSTTDAIDRIPFNYGVIYKPDKTIVANNWAQLWSSSLNSMISMDENRAPRASEVFTGSDPSGRKKLNHCSNWTSSSNWISFSFGASNTLDGRWLDDSYYSPNCEQWRPIYCIASLTPAQNNVSVPINIQNVVSYVSGQRIGSSAFGISGIGSPVSVSITGAAGTPRLRINGGPEESNSTITNGQSIEFFMDAPIAAGNTNTSTIQIGASTYTWRVSYADSARTGRIFVSSAAYQGALGGLSGADTKCQTLAAAAGLSGTYVAVLSTDTVDAQDRVPFNWGTLRRTDNVVVANNWTQFISGNLAATPNRNESGVVRGSEVFTASTSSLKKQIGRSCSNWTSSSHWISFSFGASNTLDGRWLDDSYYSPNCEQWRPIYCMSSGP